MRWRKHKNSAAQEIDPEDILLDAHNLPSYNANRLEGKLTQPISVRALTPLIVVVVCAALVVMGRTGQLMAVEGISYRTLSEQNRLDHSRLLAERGVVYDRLGEKLIWNVPHIENGVNEVYHERSYASTTGSSHVLGYVRMPARDASGVLFLEGIEGVAGVELAYDAILRGEDGIKLVETDARMDVVSESVLKEPQPGSGVRLTIDTRLQEALYGYIQNLADDVPFRGGAGVIMDVETGELLAMTSYPEYSPAALVTGDAEKIATYTTNERTPYLNRIISGQYTPGSIVKPYMAIAALTEGVVVPSTSFVSTGALRLENPYNPGQYSTFADWRAHGVVDMKRALAVSSNVYFYYVGGGFGEQEGLGISRIEQYMRLFGLGASTGISLKGERVGVIPTPAWKEATFPTDPVWRIGDTYHTAIGQYGFQVTPIQMVRAMAALANGGKLLTPRIETEHTQYGVRSLDLQDQYLAVVRGGMREAVLSGTTRGMNVSYVDVAAKTGTAEVGYDKAYVHSWVMGYYPYTDPKYAFVVLMEHGPRENLMGGTSVMRNFIDWMHTNTPEYVLFDENE